MCSSSVDIESNLMLLCSVWLQWYKPLDLANAVSFLACCLVFLVFCSPVLCFQSSVCVKPKRSMSGEAQGPSDEKIAVVSVDDCDTALSLRFGTQLGNYSCAAQGKQTSNKKWVHLVFSPPSFLCISSCFVLKCGGLKAKHTWKMTPTITKRIHLVHYTNASAVRARYPTYSILEKSSNMTCSINTLWRLTNQCSSNFLNKLQDQLHMNI